MMLETGKQRRKHTLDVSLLSLSLSYMFLDFYAYNIWPVLYSGYEHKF